MQFESLPEMGFHGQGNLNNPLDGTDIDSSNFQQTRAGNSMLKCLEFIEPEKDQYAPNLGRPVRVVVGSRDTLGIYQGCAQGEIVLQPCVMGECYGDNSADIFVQRLSQRPSFTSMGLGVKVMPVNQDYIDYMLAKSKADLERLGLLELESQGSGI